MDWRGILGIAINLIPGLREAIAWLNKHVINYYVYVKENEVIIKINVDNDEDAKHVANYMDILLRTIIPIDNVKARVVIK